MYIRISKQTLPLLQTNSFTQQSCAAYKHELLKRPQSGHSQKLPKFFQKRNEKTYNWIKAGRLLQKLPEASWKLPGSFTNRVTAALE